MTRTVKAFEDPALAARVVSTRPLPGVRAGSGLAWLGERLAIIQDDAPVIALVDPRSGAIEHRSLPAGGWDKASKLDLEACIADGERLVAFGSGSTPARERVVIADPDDIRVVDAKGFYAVLRSAADFAGSELNVEGAVLRGDRLLFLQRGNGAPRDGRTPVDATCAIDWPALRAHLDGPVSLPAPPPRDVVRYELGALGGVRLTFTDGASSQGRVVFLAVAEDCPDTYLDGPVVGAVLGVIDWDGAARWTRLADAQGRPFAEKAEGLAMGSSGGRAWIVLDRDDPGVPAVLCEVTLEGF